MSWYSRRLFLISTAALAGCGFEPAYGPTGTASVIRGQIRVSDPTDRDSFDLVTRIEDRIGKSSAAPYDMTIDLSVDEEALAITPAQEITRYNVVGQVRWRVYAAGDENALVSGTVNNFTSYSATGTTVSTLAAQADARARLMTALADQIVTRLIATAPEWSG